jgi:uncharacterized protein (TIRG00374 family)
MWFERPRSLGRKLGLSRQRVFALVGIVLFGGVLYYAGPGAWQRVLAVDIRYLLIAFMVCILLTASSATRWGLITNAVAKKRVCSYLYYFYYFVIGRVSGLFVSRSLGDFAIRPLALRAANPLSIGWMFYAVFLDKLFDLSVLGVLLVPSILYILRWLPLGGYVLLVFLAFLGLSLFWWRYDRLLRAILGWVSQNGPRWLLRSEKTGRWLDWIDLGEDLVSKGVVMRAYLITLVRFVLLTVQFYLISVALHLPFSFWQFWGAIPLVQLGLLVAITPGALGILEVGWLGVLALLGGAEADCNSFVVGQRIFVSLFIFVMGLSTSLWILLLAKEKK